MKGSEDKCSCIKYNENGVSEQFGDAVFISVIFSRGGISPFWSPWPFPAAGNLFLFMGWSIFNVAIFKSEEIEHAVKPNGVDGLLGVGHDAGFGVEGDAQSGFSNHR